MRPRPVSVLGKLRGRSAAELRSRSLQLARTWLERAGLSPYVGEPTDDVFWSRLRNMAHDRRRPDPERAAGILVEAGVPDMVVERWIGGRRR